MRKTLVTLGSVVLAVALVVGAVLGAWLVFTKSIALLTSLKSDLAVALVAASIAGLVSIVTLIISKAYEARLASREALRSKKTPVYEGIVATLFRVMFAEQLGEPSVPENELIRWFATTTEKLSIWGSNDLIKAFGEFKQHAGDEIGALFVWEQLVFAIRKDLGHRGSLQKGDVLRLFVNDISDYL